MERENNKLIVCSLSKDWGSQNNLCLISKPLGAEEEQAHGRTLLNLLLQREESHCEVTGFLFPILGGLTTPSLKKALRALELNQEKVKHNFWQALREAESKRCKGIQEFVSTFAAVPLPDTGPGRKEHFCTW